MRKNSMNRGTIFMEHYLKEKVVLITDATGGIGQALTPAFMRKGWPTGLIVKHD